MDFGDVVNGTLTFSQTNFTSNFVSALGNGGSSNVDALSLGGNLGGGAAWIRGDAALPYLSVN